MTGADDEAAAATVARSVAASSLAKVFIKTSLLSNPSSTCSDNKN